MTRVQGTRGQCSERRTEPLYDRLWIQCPLKAMVSHSNCSGKPLEGNRQRSDVIWFAFQKNHQGWLDCRGPGWRPADKLETNETLGRTRCGLDGDNGVRMREANRLERCWGGASQDVRADWTNRWEGFSGVGNTWDGQALRRDNGLSLQHVELAVNVGYPGRNGHWKSSLGLRREVRMETRIRTSFAERQLKPGVWTRPLAGVKSVLTCRPQETQNF